MFKFNIYELGDITCVEQEDEDRLWLGTNDRGLLLWNIKTGKTESVYALDAYPVVSLLKASDGQLWAGTFNGGLYRIGERRVSRFTVEQGDLSGNNVWTLAEDGEGRIWIGYLDKGLQYYSPETERFVTYPTIGAFVVSLSLTDDDRLAIGTSGLAFLDLKTLAMRKIRYPEIIC